MIFGKLRFLLCPLLTHRSKHLLRLSLTYVQDDVRITKRTVIRLDAFSYRQ